MKDSELLNEINEAREEFEKACGRGCAKYSGALTVELVRRALENHGIRTSARDVYIRGVPIEIDLLIPRRGAVPKNGILYEREDVMVVFEVKNLGVMEDAALVKIADFLQTVRKANPEIKCIYLTISEWVKWKEGVKDGDGFRSFALFWHHGSRANRRYDPTGSWEQLLSYLKDIVNG
jgi:hypothetical protein